MLRSYFRKCVVKMSLKPQKFKILRITTFKFRLKIYCIFYFYCFEGIVTLNGKRKALPVVTGDLAVRQASVSFLLIQAFGAQLLWYLEGPLALISLQPGFANKVTCTDVSCSVLQNEALHCMFRLHQCSTGGKKTFTQHE